MAVNHEDSIPFPETKLLLATKDKETGKMKFEGFNPDVLKIIEDFPVHEEDVYLCGFPKSGNVWTGTIVGAILMQDDLETFRNTRPDPSRMIELFPDLALKLAHPGFFASHLPYSLLPKGVREKKVKIISIMRNPKDVVVSFFHFHSLAKNLIPFAKPWDDFIQDFMNGSNAHGNYYDHIKSFWEIRDQSNILMLEYEDLKRDTRFWIAKIADFLERPLNDEKLDKIVEITAFNNMKKSMLDPTELPIFVQGGSFMRKGQVGDWRSVFSEDQKKRFDEVTNKFYEEIGRPFSAE